MLSILPGKYFLRRCYSRLIFTLIFCFFSLEASSLTWKKITNEYRGGFIEFTYDTTWVVPLGVKKINVIVNGAGGGTASFTIMDDFTDFISIGGGGGGGSCIKQGSTVLISADGGDGGAAFDSFDQYSSPLSLSGKSGQTVITTLNVTPGSTLSIYVGGGGGAGGVNEDSYEKGGSGGYGFCGKSGNGGRGKHGSSGGNGGVNVGDGQGGGNAIKYDTVANGENAVSSVGAGPSGGSSIIPGITNLSASGGASGGRGGGFITYYNDEIKYNGTYATGRAVDSSSVSKPGRGGGVGVFNMYYSLLLLEGGFGGSVQISW